MPPVRRRTLGIFSQLALTVVVMTLTTYFFVSLAFRELDDFRTRSEE